MPSPSLSSVSCSSPRESPLVDMPSIAETFVNVRYASPSSLSSLSSLIDPLVDEDKSQPCHVQDMTTPPPDEFGGPAIVTAGSNNNNSTRPSTIPSCASSLVSTLTTTPDDCTTTTISTTPCLTTTAIPTKKTAACKQSSSFRLLSSPLSSPLVKKPSSSVAIARPNTDITIKTKPIQFINNTAPVVPRPKPAVVGLGTYVQTPSAIQQKTRRQLREDGKIKRYSNCFIKYRTRMHPLIVAKYGNQNNKEISKLAGQCWREEPEWVKSFYRQQAKEEKQKHEALYPNYKYTPARTSVTTTVAVSKVKESGCDGSNHDPTPGSSVVLQEGHRRSDADPTIGHDEGASAQLDALGVERASSFNVEINPKPTREGLADKKTGARTAPTPTKSSKKRSFVVTETALHEFMGDSDLTAKKPPKYKNKSMTRSSRANRIKSDADAAIDITMKRTTSISSIPTALHHPPSSSEVVYHPRITSTEFSKEFAFVMQGSSMAMPLYDQTESSMMSPLSGCLPIGYSPMLPMSTEFPLAAFLNTPLEFEISLPTKTPSNDIHNSFQALASPASDPSHSQSLNLGLTMDNMTVGLTPVNPSIDISEGMGMQQDLILPFLTSSINGTTTTASDLDLNFPWDFGTLAEPTAMAIWCHSGIPASASTSLSTPDPILMPASIRNSSNAFQFCVSDSSPSVSTDGTSTTEWIMSSLSAPSPETAIPSSIVTCDGTSVALDRHCQTILETEAHAYTDEELRMSIDYYERVLEVQKKRLALQQQQRAKS
ncbi:hypothetical protein EDD11_004027 [Mortierella claussenii]|nr:hypothetical protein EDD11_004027 [Mortierella claussenii]